MHQRRVMTLLGTGALITLFFGCATQKTDAVARLTESDALRSALPNELVGTWSGRFGPVGGADGGGGNGMVGDMTLEIKDDGTYTLISTRRGRGDAAGTTTKDSGVVVANGNMVTLKSSSGQWIRLMHKGDALYGVSTHLRSGYTIHMSMEKASGTFASPRLKDESRPAGH
jgi:hypothetical protein